MEANMKEVVDFLTENHLFYVATVDGDKPKVRPFAFFMEFEGKLYFGTNDSKPSYAQLVANPNFELSTTSKDGKEWIRLSGKAVFDIRPEVVAKAVEAAPYLKSYEKPDMPTLELFYVADGEAVFQTLTTPPRTIKL